MYDKLKNSGRQWSPLGEEEQRKKGWQGYSVEA